MTVNLQISCGNGPEECCWVVEQVCRAIETEAAERGVETARLHEEPSDQKGGFRSLVLMIDQSDESSWLQTWTGTILWTGKSRFRPHHKRKNWYVAVKLIEDKPQDWKINDRDLKVETFRSSGAGGQHVNKVSSAVRITHLPSGKSVVAQESRSQQMNRKVARARIEQLLQIENERLKENAGTTLWKNHQQVERGNSIRTYTGEDFRRVM